MVLAPFLTGLLLTFSAWGQGPVCKKYDEIAEVLTKKYNETVISVGVDDQGMLVEVWESANGTTWSIVRVNPRGIACLVFSGEGWRRTLPLVQEPET